MNFKEQMQAKASEYASIFIEKNAYEKKYARIDFEEGYQAALSSDLFKELVEAGDKILEWWKQDEETGILNADEVMTALNTALTNYK